MDNEFCTVSLCTFGFLKRSPGMCAQFKKGIWKTTSKHPCPPGHLSFGTVNLGAFRRLTTTWCYLIYFLYCSCSGSRSYCCIYGSFWQYMVQLGSISKGQLEKHKSLHKRTTMELVMDQVRKWQAIHLFAPNFKKSGSVQPIYSQ